MAKWPELWNHPAQDFADYIVITGSAQRESSFWFGLIESKLRRLKDKIETDCRYQVGCKWCELIGGEEPMRETDCRYQIGSKCCKPIGGEEKRR